MPIFDEQARKVVDVFVGSTFRTLGAGALAQTLAAFGNAAASGFYLAVRRLNVSMDSTAALTAVSPYLRLRKSDAQPSAGTAWPLFTIPASTRTLATHSSSLVALQATASDGGAPTTITGAPVSGNPIWGMFASRQHTAVGFNTGQPFELLPDGSPFTFNGQPYVIAPGDNLLVRVEASAVTSLPLTTHFIVSVELEVFTIQ